MPEHLSPGVYVEEVPSGPVPIQGVSTSTLNIVGCSERGPFEPTLVTSWRAYRRVYPDQGMDSLYGPLSSALQRHCETVKSCFAIARLKRDAGPVERLRPPVDSS